LLWAVACGVPGESGTEEEFAIIKHSLDETCGERDEALLLGLKTGEGRTCVLDEDCPWGSSCNESTRKCDWKCLEGNPAYACTEPGKVCNGCSGQCVVEGSGSSLVITRQLPRVDLMPAFVQFERTTDGTSWRHHQLTVGLAVTDAVAASKATGTVINVVAGPEMEVACATSGGFTPFTGTCTLSTWSFSPFGTGQRATALVQVRPLASSTATSWHVTLESAAATPQRVRLQAEPAASITGGGSVREFWGTATLAPSGEGTTPVVLTVRGWANETQLLLYDETRTLSPSGKVKLGSATPHVAEWLPSSSGTSTLDAMTARVSGTFNENPLGSTVLTGSFTVALPQPVAPAAGGSHPLTASFRMSRVEDVTLTSCPANACQPGYVCENGLGVCLPGVRQWTGAGDTLANTIVSEQRQEWDAEGQALLTAGLTAFGQTLEPWQLARGLICNQGSTQGTPELAGLPFYGDRSSLAANLLPHSADLRCRNGSPPSVADFFTQWDRYPDSGGLKNLSRLTMTEMLNECLEDLQRPAVNSSTSDTASWFNQRFGSLYGVKSARTTLTAGRQTPGRCFNLARFYAALNLSARESSSIDQKLAWRLLQQWISVHGFMAQQVAQARESVDFLGTKPDGVNIDPTWPDIPTTLGRFEKAWDVLLDGSYAGLIPTQDATRTCSLSNPDYRLPPRPVASWKYHAGSGTTLVTRAGARWQRAKTAFLFHNPDLWNACSSTTLTHLFSTSYTTSEGSYPGARSLLAHCTRKEPAVDMTIQGARKTVTATSSNATLMSYWWPAAGISSTQRDLSFAVVERDGQSTLYMDGTSSTSPSQRTLSFGHFVLNAPYVQTMYPPEANRLAVWDFIPDTGMLDSAVNNPTQYVDTPTSDYATLPGAAHHEQSVGLPAVILEGLAAHVRLLNVELEAAERNTLANCSPPTPGSNRDVILTRFGRTMRYALTLEALAAVARARELAQCSPAAVSDVVWDKRWQAAKAELDSVRRQAYEKIRAISSCHPYGMPENEAPLYFGSNATDPKARFFGSSTYLHGNAVDAVNQAKIARDGARNAWVAQRNTEVQEALNTSNQDVRIRELKRQYGTPIIQMCGLTDLSAEDVFDRFDPVKSMERWQKPALRPESCFLRNADPVCQIAPAELHSKVKLQHARFTLCTWNKLAQHTPLQPGDAFLASRYGDAGLTVGESPAGSGNYLVSHGGTSIPVARLYGQPVDLEKIPPKALQESHDACVSELGGAGAALPTPSSIGRKLDSSCYQGEMGSAMLSIVGANQSLQVAQSQWGEFQEKFDIAQQRCMSMDAAADKQIELNNTYQTSMRDLIRQKGQVDRRINNLSDLNSKAEGIVGGLVVSIATGNVPGMILGGLKLLGAGAENRYKDKAIRLGEDMQRLELAHKTEIEALQLNAAVDQCYIEAQANLVGIRTAALQVDRVGTEVDAALLAMENMEGRVRQLLLEGTQVVEQEKARQIPSFSHHFWLDEQITSARQYFATAKHFSFLFAKALEYEKQQSHPALGAILSAAGPDQLANALNQYAYQYLDKRVHGAEPDSVPYPLVAQLRGNVLNLGDRLSVPYGERGLTKAERFTRRLLSSEHAVYDDTGNYMGQGIRFAMPSGLLTNRCAERVWTVHAYLRGDDRLSTWISTHGLVPLLLRKRNTFSSHLCKEPGWQTAAVHPSINGDSVGTPRPGEADTFTLASVSAHAGSMELADFQMSGAGIGSTEWKGRGLYGEYEVVFPWNGLMTRNGVSTHFPLDGVTDVWLRFEQVSVATTLNQ
jgi:hypothetical protein